jgi:D-serine deaminase-like pyridoxal phosphate-dependent protein
MIPNKENWYLIADTGGIDSPALVIYLDRVKENIRLLKSMIDDPRRLRPHVKTHKTKEAALLLMEAGIDKFKCATIAEAEMLAMAKAADVLLAYQPVGPKADRLISLIQNYPATKFSCLIDDISAAEYISAKAERAGLRIPVYIDLNVGMNRTGISPDKEAVELYRRCSQLKGVAPVGLHVYDGHISDPDPVQREKKCNEAFAPVERLKIVLMEEGFAEPLIVAGGSPSFPFHAKRKKIECSPGTFIYWDAGYQQSLADQPFLPAALVLSRVISVPDERIICTDLGHKSIAAENELGRRVRFLNAPDLELIAQSEEHMTTRTETVHPYKIGDLLYGLPFHICPTCALYERALIVENGKITGEWRMIARDRRIHA